MEEALEASNDLVLEVQGPMAITSNMMCHVGLTGATQINVCLYSWIRCGQAVI
jgi:hypothetical protein